MNFDRESACHHGGMQILKVETSVQFHTVCLIFRALVTAKKWIEVGATCERTRISWEEPDVHVLWNVHGGRVQGVRAFENRDRALVYVEARMARMMLQVDNVPMW